MHLLDIIFPKYCVGCGRIGSYICRNCRNKIEYLTETDAICPVCRRKAIAGLTHPRCRGRGKADGFVSFFRYEGVVRKIIKTVKFRYAFLAIEELMDLIPLTSYNSLKELTGGTTVIVTEIPLSTIRLRDRGFNQAQLIARILAKKLRLEADSGILVRNRDNSPQATIKAREKRIANVENLFRISIKAERTVRNQKIILVDDVSTTGATLHEATKILKAAGVKAVYEVSLAR